MTRPISSQAQRFADIRAAIEVERLAGEPRSTRDHRGAEDQQHVADVDPVIDALTTPTSPCDNAIKAMINSAALPTWRSAARRCPACTRAEMFRGPTHPAG